MLHWFSPVFFKLKIYVSYDWIKKDICNIDSTKYLNIFSDKFIHLVKHAIYTSVELYDVLDHGK